MTAPTGLYAHRLPSREPTLKEAAMEAAIAAELDQAFGLNETRRDDAREALLAALAKRGIGRELAVGMGRVLR